MSLYLMIGQLDLTARKLDLTAGKLNLTAEIGFYARKGFYLCVIV